ncbi:DUF6506 family protein [Streptomyces hainanensis]|uniref:Uncharacterized protein n=1 Tax=Streptomyces hainanensis TaxID=402648 RepID=A0A4R4TNU5_9ACTN|nr:DUF6506 family protein [Streptomyces hainanensis]TDC75759.1 hypothetical protein E1283_11490 [Streptomyces hainanensis]
MLQSVVIYPQPDADPEKDRIVFEAGGRRVTLVAVRDEDTAAPVVAGLVDEGAALVELCGGFGPTRTAKVIAEVGDRAPVGAIGYAGESLAAISRFHLAWLAGEVQSELFLVLVPGADPERDRVVREHGGGARFTTVAVPDIEAAERVAARESVGLIELYGGFGADAAARVHAAAGGAPVGTVVFGIDEMDAAAALRA